MPVTRIRLYVCPHLQGTHELALMLHKNIWQTWFIVL